MRVGGEKLEPAGLHEPSLGQRVSEPERRRILERLVELTSQHDVDLLLIHPAYQASRPHECVLTRFARETAAPLVEARPALHPRGVAAGSLFRDSWHPRSVGHARLARMLAAEVGGRYLAPPSGSSAPE